MRVLICGDRNWTNRRVIVRELKTLKDVECVIEGGARGADSIGKFVATQLGIKVREFKAEWDKYGRRAGPIRNQQMIDEGKPDLILAFHNNIKESKGTKDMVKRAKKSGIETKIISEWF